MNTADRNRQVLAADFDRLAAAFAADARSIDVPYAVTGLATALMRRALLMPFGVPTALEEMVARGTSTGAIAAFLRQQVRCA